MWGKNILRCEVTEASTKWRGVWLAAPESSAFLPVAAPRRPPPGSPVPAWPRRRPTMNAGMSRRRGRGMGSGVRCFSKFDLPSLLFIRFACLTRRWILEACRHRAISPHFWNCSRKYEKKFKNRVSAVFFEKGLRSVNSIINRSQMPFTDRKSDHLFRRYR